MEKILTTKTEILDLSNVVCDMIVYFKWSLFSIIYQTVEGGSCLTFQKDFEVKKSGLDLERHWSGTRRNLFVKITLVENTRNRIKLANICLKPSKKSGYASKIGV